MKLLDCQDIRKLWGQPSWGWGPDAQATKCHPCPVLCASWGRPQKLRSPLGVGMAGDGVVGVAGVVGGGSPGGCTAGQPCYHSNSHGAGTWPTLEGGMGRRKECPVKGKRHRRAAPSSPCFSYPPLQVCLVFLPRFHFLTLTVTMVRSEWPWWESAFQMQGKPSAGGGGGKGCPGGIGLVDSSC